MKNNVKYHVYGGDICVGYLINNIFYDKSSDAAWADLHPDGGFTSRVIVASTNKPSFEPYKLVGNRLIGVDGNEYLLKEET